MQIAYGLSVFIVLLLVISIVFSISSCSKTPQLGLRDNKLSPCPSTPNCVCSEYPGHVSFIAPLPFTGYSDLAWQLAKETIITMEGEIITDMQNYIHAVFRSRIFRFVDDLEIRLDKNTGVLHLRSASRVGYSDLGMNKKRVETFRTLYAKKMIRNGPAAQFPSIKKDYTE